MLLAHLLLAFAVAEGQFLKLPRLQRFPCGPTPKQDANSASIPRTGTPHSSCNTLWCQIVSEMCYVPPRNTL
jgi:hypothetical protein